MTYGFPRKITDNEARWLEAVMDDTPEPPKHICGRCRTPWGRSLLPCPNEPDRTEYT